MKLIHSHSIWSQNCELIWIQILLWNTPQSDFTTIDDIQEPYTNCTYDDNTTYTNVELEFSEMEKLTNCTDGNVLYV